METQELIQIDIFCEQHQVEMPFISALQEFGLIEIRQINQEKFLPASQLAEAEKFVRLHRELEINLEGIDVITHLLNRISELQSENLLLKNRLRFYGEYE